jgi:hypothetical protein
MAEAGWTLNPLVAIGIGIAVMFFGYFFGLFEGRGQGYKKRQKEEAEDRKHKPLSESLPPASPPLPSDEIPVLNVSMGPDGEMRLKMDGQPADPSALDAEQRKRLIAILTQMRPWLEAPKTAAPPPKPQPAPASRPGPAPKPTPAPSPAPAADERPTAPPPPDQDEEEEHPPAADSIVAQIDSVLQARLAGTPLAAKGIRLQESPEGGVLVWVGVSKYEGVDEVPDEEIKAALRAAISEWENTFTPGL